MSAPLPAGDRPPAARRGPASRSALVPSILPSLFAFLGLSAVLGVAAALRWGYATSVSLHVDEFTTLWAAQRVLQSGVPIMPSGVLYTRGLLGTYITALSGLLAGGIAGERGYLVGRLPSVLFGLGTIAAIWIMGRKCWNARVGWLAALGLALLPEAIVWSARARFYAPFQFLTLLTLWAAYAAIRGTAGEGASRAHFLFAALFVLALFSQEQAFLLYPPILLASFWWRGGRYLLDRRVWPAHLLCLGAMALRFGLEIWGQPGQFETIQAQRPYVGLILDPAAAWGAYAPLLVSPLRLPLTLLGILALGAALADLRRAGGRPLGMRPFHAATLFFGLQLGFVLCFLLLFVGGQWREARYLFFVQPLWLLLGAAGAVWGLDALGALLRRGGAVRGTWAGGAWRLGTAAAVALLLSAGWWAAARGVLDQQVEGYDKVLAYVGEQRKAGEIVLTPQPPACAYVLGPCDYYAVQRVYEEFVVPRGLRAGGELVDRWSGAPLLNDVGGLEEAVRGAPGAWLVTDRFRLATRYEEDFLAAVIEQFDVAYEERGVLALKASGWREEPSWALDESLAVPLRVGPLELTRWAYGAVPAGVERGEGAALPVELTWRGVGPIGGQINTSVRLLDGGGNVVASADGPPARGIVPTNLFFGTALPDRKSLLLPAGLAAGEYRLEVVAYDLATVTPLGEPLAVGTVVVGE